MMTVRTFHKTLLPALTLLAVSAISGRCLLPNQAVAAESVGVSVDAGKTAGRLSPLFRAGVFTFSTLLPEYVQEEYFRALKPGCVEIDLGREILADSRDRADVMARLAMIAPLLQRTRKGGGEVVLGFSKIPRWLSSRPSDNSPAMPGDRTPVAVVSPPRDYDQWASLVEAIVGYVRSLGVDACYKIGWEPDTRIWQGTEEEFFRLYRYSVLGARRADRQARIGGPGVSGLGPFWRGEATATPMLQRFIEYCGRTQIAELGLRHLPLDFVSIHVFGAAPDTTYVLHAGIIRGWLRKNGYGEGSKLHLGEWSDSPAPFSPQRETSYLASFIVSNLIAMDKAGFDQQSFTSLVDQQVKEETQFSGGLGLFTKDFIIRPSFNAFQMLGMLGDTRLPLETSDPWIFGIAGKDRGRVSVLVTNHVLSGRSLVRSFMERIMLKGYGSAEIGRYFRNAETMEQVIRNRESLTRLNLPPAMEKDAATILSEIRDLGSLMKARGERSTRVIINLKGLSWLGDFRLRELRIDSRNGNPVRAKGEIDAIIGKRLRDIPAEVEREMDTHLSAKGYSKADAQEARRFIGARDKRAFMDRLSGNDRARVLEMIGTLRSVKDSKTAVVSRQINSRSDARPGLVQDKPMSRMDSLAVTLDLEPNAVSLIVLEGRP